MTVNGQEVLRARTSTSAAGEFGFSSRTWKVYIDRVSALSD